MACSYKFNLSGHDLVIHVGLGESSDGPVISPETDIALLDQPDYIEALKKAIQLYPLLRKYTLFEAWAWDYSRIDTDNKKAYALARLDEDDINTYISTFNQVKDRNLLAMPEYAEVYIKALRVELDRRATRQAIKIEKEAKALARQSTPGYVYLLKSPTGYYKIGKAKDPNNRMKTFEVKLPFEVEFECLIKTPNMGQLESSLHNQFAPQRVNGEWFKLEPAHVEYIKSLAVQS